MQQFDEFTAIVKIRSGGEFVPRISALALNNRAVKVEALWPIEGRRPYADGEWACQIEGLNGERLPFRGWIASGDLVFL